MGRMAECFKIEYPDKRTAKQALRAIRKNPTRSERGVYKCKCCAGWHLSSQK